MEIVTIFDRRAVCADGTTLSFISSSQESYRFYTKTFTYIPAHQKRGDQCERKGSQEQVGSKEYTKTKCRTIKGHSTMHLTESAQKCTQ